MQRDLDEVLRSMVKRRVLLRAKQATRWLTPIASRFGGLPYMEAGESWPICDSCDKELSFVGQIDLRAAKVEDPVFELVALYYCWDCFPFDGPFDHRAYRGASNERAVACRPSAGTDIFTMSEITFEEALSLPCWEAADAVREVNGCDHDAYKAAVERVAGEQVLTSSLVGYPTWLQSEAAPAPGARFFAQLDGVTIPGHLIDWGDSGMLYLFVTTDEPLTTDIVMQTM